MRPAWLHLLPYGATALFLYGVYLLMIAYTDDLVSILVDTLTCRVRLGGVYSAGVYTAVYFVLFYIWAALCVVLFCCGVAVFWGGRWVVDRTIRRRLRKRIEAS